MYYSLANTCENQVKFCTLKVQIDIQLTISKLWLSIEDCRSRSSVKNFEIKDLRTKILNDQIL